MTFASGTPDRPYDPVDLSSTAFWSTTMDERERAFSQLRKRGTLTWHRPLEDQVYEVPDDYGFWAATTYDDVVEITKRSGDFISEAGILLENLTPEILEISTSIIQMDPPRHTSMRRLVSAAFTPKQIKRINDRITANARTVVDNLLAKIDEGGGSADFVAECAQLLPMHNINDMMGVPDGLRQQVTAELNIANGWGDSELAGMTKDQVVDRIYQAVRHVNDVAVSLAAERRDDPQNDLITALAQAEIDGERLTDKEIGSFFLLMVSAGNDTTRQSTSHGLRALTTHPEQREWLLEDLEGRISTAVEEFVRWATPIMTFRRTAARDIDFKGAQIRQGDKVVMFYSSANRDETRIDRPHEFDLSRHPNPHISFGGGGIHHCLGNQLARFQLRALFTELLTRAPQLKAGDPELQPGTFFHVVKSMPVYL
ncbi:cytochrome P450 [Amycolatopsis sp. GM8]|uniref:cytochrome P450 n=1 Tax=Amycolatopsis sp. GM8 TaxID=2896530 RepID=UPI001F19B793|nr:cytochrome P450 [Amycolatopsis sp. GM8]